MKPPNEAVAAELAALIPDKRQALRIAAMVGLESPVPATGDVGQTWREIVDAAERQHRIGQLLDRCGIFAAETPADIPTPHLALDPMIDDPLAEPSWAVFDEPDMRLYEQRIGDRDTFLPVSFLRAGVVASRSVCKISYEKRDDTGAPRRVFGTGFMIGPDELLTCFHVLRNAATAASAIAEFNYEIDESGAQVEPEQVRLAPERGFVTSGSLTYDWTIVRTERAVGDDYGFLTLQPVNHADLAFVNIIGHPDGRTKQVSLYHNLVERYDSDRVLYTTETADGSSGSPVFDSEWRVVAMHNGTRRTFQLNMMRRVVRNAGININRIIERAGAFGRVEQR